MTANSLRPERKVAFFHIMKTGGMTFRSILSKLYGDQFHVCDDPSIEAIESAIARFQCIEFHIMPWQDDWIHLHANLAQQRRWDLFDGMDLFTMLRDPVDQFLSQYFYLVSIRSSVEPILNAKGLPFPESLEWLLDHPAAFNDQLAFLAGKSQRSGICVTRDDLEQVQEILALRFHVGITESFADSVHVFQTVTGHPLTDRIIENRNQNPNRPSLESVSQAIKDRIREQSRLDVELYEFGQKLFVQDLARCGPADGFSFVAETAAEGAGDRKEAAMPLALPAPSRFRSRIPALLSKWLSPKQ